MARRSVIAMALVVAVSVLGFANWARSNGQMVNLVIVNESGEPVEFSWQPAPFAEMVSVTRSGCESSSEDLRASLEWRLTRNGEVILDSSKVAVPLFARGIAFTVTFERNGAVRTDPVREVDAPLDTPMPDCGQTGSAE